MAKFFDHNILPFTKNNVLNHEMEKSNEERYRLYRMLEDFKKSKELRVVQSKPSEKETKNSVASIAEKYQIFFNKYDSHFDLENEINKRFLKDMVDMHYVLGQHREKLSDLPSIKKLKENQDLRKIQEEQQKFKEELQNMILQK